MRLFAQSVRATRTLRRLLVLAAVLVFASACSPSVVSFTIGECVNLPDGEVIDDYETVDCAEPHDGEVFALPQMPDAEGAPFDQTAISDFALDRCNGQTFTDYVGEPWDTSMIYTNFVSPSQESWENADDREIVCLLAGEPFEDGSGNRQLVGSKENSGE